MIEQRSKLSRRTGIGTLFYPEKYVIKTKTEAIRDGSRFGSSPTPRTVKRLIFLPSQATPFLHSISRMSAALTA